MSTYANGNRTHDLRERCSSSVLNVQTGWLTNESEQMLAVFGAELAALRARIGLHAEATRRVKNGVKDRMHGSRVRKYDEVASSLLVESNRSQYCFGA